MHSDCTALVPYAGDSQPDEELVRKWEQIFDAYLTKDRFHGLMWDVYLKYNSPFARIVFESTALVPWKPK